MTKMARRSSNLAPFQHPDHRVVVAALVVEFFDLSPRLLDGVRIGRIADLQPGLLLQRSHVDLVAADELHVLQHRPLDHLEDHDAPAGNLLPVGLHVDELMRVVEPANVFRDQFEVERPAGAGADARQDLLQRQRLVARDLHVDDHCRAVKRRPASRSARDRPGREPARRAARSEPSTAARFVPRLAEPSTPWQRRTPSGIAISAQLRWGRHSCLPNVPRFFRQTRMSAPPDTLPLCPAWREMPSSQNR